MLKTEQLCNVGSLNCKTSSLLPRLWIKTRGNPACSCRPQCYIQTLRLISSIRAKPWPAHVREDSPPPCERSPGEALQARSTLAPWTPASSGSPAGRQQQEMPWSARVIFYEPQMWYRLSFTLRMMSGLEASAGRASTSPLMVWVCRRYLR